MYSFEVKESTTFAYLPIHVKLQFMDWLVVQVYNSSNYEKLLNSFEKLKSEFIQQKKDVRLRMSQFNVVETKLQRQAQFDAQKKKLQQDHELIVSSLKIAEEKGQKAKIT